MTLRANELRIGNLVWEEYSGDMIVFGIVTGGINPRIELRKHERFPAGSYLIEMIQGIPLTEEWLLKFGFEKSDDQYGGYLIDLAEDEKIRVVNNGFGWEWPIYGNTPCKTDYVHQLQNLYFALTGEELTLADHPL